MKLLLLSALFFSASTFAVELRCFRDIDQEPIYKIDSVREEIIYKDDIGDASTCKFNEHKISCSWFKHWMHVDLSKTYKTRFLRKKYYRGKMTLIAPPGWTWDITCYLR